MERTYTLKKRVMAMLLCIAMIASYLPAVALTASAAAPYAMPQNIVTDPGTAADWETALNVEMDGNRYAGRLWADKSVYAEGDTVLLNTRGEAGSSFQVELEDDETFQTVFSVLGTSMTTTSKSTSSGPMDVVLVIDTSTSMDDTVYDYSLGRNVTRLERVIDAANLLLDDLATIQNIRIAIVTYNADSETVLELGAYTNGVNLVVNNYYNNSRPDAGVVYAYDDGNNLLGNDSGFTAGTNTQAGIDRGFNILANATNVTGRAPVAIVLTDGQANRSVTNNWYALENARGTGTSGRCTLLGTLLNAAYNKALVEKHYGVEQTVYTVSVDIGNNAEAKALMNPGDATAGFNTNNRNGTVEDAYELYETWVSGRTASYSNYTFDHRYPTEDGMTDQDVISRINYADFHYDVESANLTEVFDQIYESLYAGPFNPIFTSTTEVGATGETGQPLIYVDRIGKHMEIKELEAVTLFGSSHNIINNNGTYTVAAATGKNPTTGEDWNTATDIRISTREENGYQILEIEIDQEILPILLEQVLSETVGNVTTATITEYIQDPLRVYYTVGLKDSVLRDDGTVDISQLAGYQHIDTVNGTVSFYSNAFGIFNAVDAANGYNGDAHIGFKPSQENRYYYHQANQGIFTNVKIDGTTFNSRYPGAASEYGVQYTPGEKTYDFTYLTYADYQSLTDDAEVYTYVTYYRPTIAAGDSNAAEEVTFLVYTNWGYLKESVGLYDMAENAKVYINYDATNGYSTGDTAYVLTEAQVQSVAQAYTAANPSAELVAVLGVNSLRTSRLHNMEKGKNANATGTATTYFAPEYTYSTSEDNHHGNDVVIWLGNNGMLTLPLTQGIRLHKTVDVVSNETNAPTEFDFTVELTPAVPAAELEILDSTGAPLASGYTVSVNAGKTIVTATLSDGDYISIHGIPADTEYTVTEAANIYYSNTAVNPTGRIQLGTVTDVEFVNTARGLGDLVVEKEIDVPDWMTDISALMNTDFTIQVRLTGLNPNATYQTSNQAVVFTADANGEVTKEVALKNTESIIIYDLPEDTSYSVKELNVPAGYAANTDAAPITGDIRMDDFDIAEVINRYTPDPVSVPLTIAGTKTLYDTSGHTLTDWNGLTFQAELYSVDATGTTLLETVTISDSAKSWNVTLDGRPYLTFDEAGIYHFNIAEKIGNETGITYDRSVGRFEIVVTDDGSGALKAVINQMAGTVTVQGSTVTKDFTNYKDAGKILIPVQKTITGSNSIPAEQFLFGLYDGTTLINTVAGVTNGTAYLMASGYYDDFVAGKTYTVKELIPSDADKIVGMSYDDTLYTVTVQWDDQAADHLTVTAVNGAPVSANYALTFTNTYTQQQALIIPPLSGTKTMAGDRNSFIAGESYTIELYKTDATFSIDGSTPIATESVSGNDYEYIFENMAALTFTEEGVYFFTIKEAAGNQAGVAYDHTVYHITVTVSRTQGNGGAMELITDTHIVALGSANEIANNALHFTNVATVEPASFTINGQKHLTGRAAHAHEFGFRLYDVAKGQFVGETTNLANGTFSFTDSKNAAGTYTYKVYEIEGNAPGVDYNDEAVANGITVTVTVDYDPNNAAALVATVDYGAPGQSAVQITNTYDPDPAKVSFVGSKRLAGAEIESNTYKNAFSFVLHQPSNNAFVLTDGNKVQTVQNNGADFAFAERVIDEPGTYYFSVVEIAGTDTDMVYDGTQHNYVVQVRDTGTGKLQATVWDSNTGTVVDGPKQNASATVRFANATVDAVTEKTVFAQGGTVHMIDGEQVDPGDILTYHIRYTNYTGKDVVVTITDAIPAHTSYVQGSASHGGHYAATHVQWVLNVERGGTEEVSFSVKVDEADGIIHNTAVVRDGVNTYHTNEVTNHTVDEIGKKDVFASADLTESIDGKDVYNGDVLTYTVTYTNITGNVADVVITDVLDRKLTYVDGTADRGGVHTDGTITWTFADVPAWQSVTVSFQAKVVANAAGTVENTAKVFENNMAAVATNKTVNRIVQPALTITKQQAVGNGDLTNKAQAVKAGDTVTYTITVTNNGEGNAYGVKVSDTIPAGLTLVEGSITNSGVLNAGVITWDVATLTPNAKAELSFKVTVPEVTETTSWKNIATYAYSNDPTGSEPKSSNEVKVDLEIQPPPATDTEVPANPITGDSFNAFTFIGLMTLSSFGLVAVIVAKKREEEKENA